MDYNLRAYAYAKDKKWNKAEKMLHSYMKNTKNITDLHFAYNSIIDYSYKQRKEDDNAIDRCLSYCFEDISLLPVFKRTWNVEYDDFETLRIPSINKSIRILKQNKHYDKLESLLEELIELYKETQKEDYYKNELKKINDTSRAKKNSDKMTKVNFKSNTNNEQKISKLKKKNMSEISEEKLISRFSKNSKWFCTISFGKSRSKNFPQALELAKMAPQYNEFSQNGNIIYQPTYSSIPTEYLNMLNLWEVINNWKSSFMNINGEIVDKRTFSKVNRCYSDRCRNNTESFCYGVSMYTKNPLGCHRAKIHESGDPWYKFGSIDNKGVFYLDKKWLKSEAIKRLISYRYFPVLNIKKVLQNIDNLPKKINPEDNEEWEYTTYLNTTTDAEYKGISKKREATYQLNIDIEKADSKIRNKYNKNKIRTWPWFFLGVIFIFTPVWFIGLGFILFGIIKRRKNS